jgi:hypothetical protein
LVDGGFPPPPEPGGVVQAASPRVPYLGIRPTLQVGPTKLNSVFLKFDSAFSNGGLFFPPYKSLRAELSVNRMFFPGHADALN